MSTSIFSILNTTTPIIMTNTTFLACRNVEEICSLVVALGWVDVTEKEISYSSPEHGLNHVQQIRFQGTRLNNEEKTK